MASLPMVIQGGMGVGVSGWKLAHAVSSYGQLGVVSGTAVDTVFIRRLQLGDAGGHLRRALRSFPIPDAAERILKRYFIEGGKDEASPFRSRPMPRIKPTTRTHELIMAANFAEVFLAKEGHDNPVGINYLEKLQSLTLPSIYGAVLAGVDYVLMGAGIPRAIPAILDKLSAGLKARLSIDVKDPAPDSDHAMELDPGWFFGEAPRLPRPKFLAIVASNVLATMLSRSPTPPDGFIVEGPTAGGHNAPPRGKTELDVLGQPIYGTRDEVDLAGMRDLGAPFWLAGSQATPDAFSAARSHGAAGIQVGTAFAFCEESGMRDDLKKSVLDRSRLGDVEVFTDPLASPTGFPFKVVEVADTLSDPDVYKQRKRICDLGYLRSAHATDEGVVEWRCPAEPSDKFEAKGGEHSETIGRKCLCNSLLANIGLGQKRQGDAEVAIVTAGDDAATIARFLEPGQTSYTAASVIDRLTSGVGASE